LFLLVKSLFLHADINPDSYPDSYTDADVNANSDSYADINPDSYPDSNGDSGAAVVRPCLTDRDCWSDSASICERRHRGVFVDRPDGKSLGRLGLEFCNIL
jgi:hypothetical protein